MAIRARLAIITIVVFGLFAPPIAADETIDERLENYAAIVWDVTLGDETIEAMVQQVAPLVYRRNPGQEDLVDEAVRDVFRDAFDELRPEMLTFMADFMRERLSDDDVIAMLDFYESPVGERVLATMPEMMTYLMGQLPQLQARMAAFAQRRLRVEFAERGLVLE